MNSVDSVPATSCAALSTRVNAKKVREMTLPHSNLTVNHPIHINIGHVAKRHEGVGAGWVDGMYEMIDSMADITVIRA